MINLDAAILKYAITDRKYMLELSKSVKPEFFDGPLQEFYAVMLETFKDPYIRTILSRDAFADYCVEKNMSELSHKVPKIFAVLDQTNVKPLDFPYYVKKIKTRYNGSIAKDYNKKIAAAIAGGVATEEINDLYKAALLDINTINKVEVLDEGSVGEDALNMKAEYESVEKNPYGFMGVTTGYPSLDVITNGFQSSELIIIAGQEGCLHHSTHLKYATSSIKDDAISSWKLTNIKALYSKFHKNKNVYFHLLSIDENNNVISNIVVDVIKSGLKTVFKLKTSNAMIEATKDHKFFNGIEYVSLESLSVGDQIMMCDNEFSKEARYDQVISIELEGERLTYDIKMLDPYNNFIADKLVVHNSGKSTLMMNMAINAWLGNNKPGQAKTYDNGHNIIYFTLEMPRSNKGNAGTGAYLNKRILSCVSELPFSELRKGALTIEQKEKLYSTIDFIKAYDDKYKFYVIDIPRGATLEDIEIKYLEVMEKFHVDLVVIDYIGIMSAPVAKGGSDQDWQSQGIIAAGLHEFARTHHVPVITAAQVTRPQGTNNSLNKQNYNTTRIARSAQITQNANVVLQIGCRDKEWEYSDMPIYITKMRDGQTGQLIFAKALDKMRIYDAVPDNVEAALVIFEDMVVDPGQKTPDYGDSPGTSNEDFGEF